MRNLLNYIPGFKSNKWWKKIVASFYYLISILMIFDGFGSMLFLLSIPFLIFSIIDLIKSIIKKNSFKKYVITTIIAFLVFTIGINNLETKDAHLGDESIGQTATANNILNNENNKVEEQPSHIVNTEDQKEQTNGEQISAEQANEEQVSEEIQNPEMDKANEISDTKSSKEDLWVEEKIEVEEEAKIIESETPKQEPIKKTVTSNTGSDVNKGYTYIGNSNTKKFHYTHCGHAKKISEKNRVYLNSREEAINGGYVPCKVCKP